MTDAAIPLRPRSRPFLRHLAREMLDLVHPPAPPVLSDLLPGLPRGDGHAVLVLPSAASGDRPTAHFRDFLRLLGYDAHGWDQGWNLGPTRRLIRGAEARLDDLHRRSGAKVSVVGFSMGGLFARYLAQTHPDQVRQAITVCSPVYQPTRSVWLPLDRILAVPPIARAWPGPDLAALADTVMRPCPVPATCLYSKNDGILLWEHCRDPHLAAADLVEVPGCHITMARNPTVFRVLAERLARVMDEEAA